MYEYGDGGDLFYLSSTSRQDTVDMLNEFIKKEGHA